MGKKFAAGWRLLQSGEWRVLAALALRWTGFNRYCRIHRPGVVLHYDGSAMGLILWVNPEARREDEAFLAAYLRPGDSVIDVGANIGSLALVAAHIVGRAGKVIAFEPHPKIFGYLQRNITLNGFAQVDARQIALGREQGEVRLTDLLHDDQNRVSASGSVIVPSARLDSMITDGHFALLKVDVEGLELWVLEGAKALLSDVECIYFEVSERHFEQYGYHVQNLADFLLSHGFTLRRWQAGRLQATAGDVDGTENWVALRACSLHRLAAFRGPAEP